MQTDGRTEGSHIEANSRFSQFCERSRKCKISARFYKGILLSIICAVCVVCTLS